MSDNVGMFLERSATSLLVEIVMLFRRSIDEEVVQKPFQYVTFAHNGRKHCASVIACGKETKTSGGLLYLVEHVVHCGPQNFFILPEKECTMISESDYREMIGY